jgi:hypothetical protein
VGNGLAYLLSAWAIAKVEEASPEVCCLVELYLEVSMLADRLAQSYRGAATVTVRAEYLVYLRSA